MLHPCYTLHTFLHPVTILIHTVTCCFSPVSPSVTMFHPCFTQLYPCLALLHILKSCTPVSPLTPLIPVTQSSPFYDHDIPCNALSHPLSPCYTPVSPCYAPPLHHYTPFCPFLHTYYTPRSSLSPPRIISSLLLSWVWQKYKVKKNVLIKMILKGQVSQVSQRGVTDWQGKAMIRIESDKKHVFVIFWSFYLRWAVCSKSSV